MTTTLEMPTTVVVFPYLVHKKIMHWVQKGGSHECSGLGITKIEDGKILVVDAFMVKQKNSGASTEMDPEDVQRLMFEQREAEGELNFWWHSHADMDVFWSSQDKETIAQIGNSGFCIASVFNKRSQIRTAIAMKEPFDIFIDEVTSRVRHEIPEDLQAMWDVEYDANVIKTTTYGGYNNNKWSDADKRWVSVSKEEAQTKREYVQLKIHQVDFYLESTDQFKLADGAYVDADTYMKDNPITIEDNMDWEDQMQALMDFNGGHHRGYN